MPITLPETLPAYDVLRREGVMVMSPERAARQDALVDLVGVHPAVSGALGVVGDPEPLDGTGEDRLVEPAAALGDVRAMGLDAVPVEAELLARLAQRRLDH